MISPFRVVRLLISDPIDIDVAQCVQLEAVIRLRNTTDSIGHEHKHKRLG
jgi:hypothetical protein